MVYCITRDICFIHIIYRFSKLQVDNDASQDTYSVELKVVFKAPGHYPPNPAPVTVTFDSKGKTAFSVLDAAKCKSCYNFKYSLSPEYGAFITSMCNVTNDYTKENSWSFYVNETKQNVGVTCYGVNANDVIEMRYEHYGSRHTEL